MKPDIEPTSVIRVFVYMCIGLPWWLSGKESACQAGDAGWIPGLGRFPWRRKWQPILVFFLPWKPHGQRSLAGYSPWGHQRVRHDLVTKRQQQIHVCECRKNTPVSAGRLCDGVVMLCTVFPESSSLHISVFTGHCTRNAWSDSSPLGTCSLGRTHSSVSELEAFVML